MWSLSGERKQIMTTLSGKTALVTGASRGIGRASALALAAAGAQVLVHYGRGANEAEAVAAEIRKAGSSGSSIVLVSSLAAHAAIGTLPAYAATKGAVDTLVKHFAAALGERGIRVNAVAPGVVETDMSNFTKTAAGRNLALGMQALKRLAQPDDIGAVVAFLASNAARWITGDIVRADGGTKL
jgi:NAD(P)-dependent dehydrogenase (short-subunit alcohol dehydrogenase family)